MRHPQQDRKSLVARMALQLQLEGANRLGELRGLELGESKVHPQA